MEKAKKVVVTPVAKLVTRPKDTKDAVTPPSPTKWNKEGAVVYSNSSSPLSPKLKKQPLFSRLGKYFSRRGSGSDVNDIGSLPANTGKVNKIPFSDDLYCNYIQKTLTEKL